MAGLTKTLHLEGAKHNIRVNTLAPVAGTRMTEDIFPEAAFKAFAPENVAPAALFLVSEDAPTNAIVGAGAGVFQSAYVTLTPGVRLTGDELSPEGRRRALGADHRPHRGDRSQFGRRADDADPGQAAIGWRSSPFRGGSAYCYTNTLVVSLRQQRRIPCIAKAISRMRSRRGF
ncbi:MAG: hypothetical protein WDN44_16135 [Sphingomonas sp.]